MALFGRARERFPEFHDARARHSEPRRVFSDLFGQLDPDGLEKAMLRAASDWAETLGDVVAVDGQVAGKVEATRGDEEVMHGDAGCQGADKRQENRDKGWDWQVSAAWHTYFDGRELPTRSRSCSVASVN